MIRLAVWMVIFVLWAAAATAADVQPTPTQYLILKTSKPIVVDGKLDEWDMAGTPYTLSADGKNPMNRVILSDAAHPVRGDADFSARAAMAWDDDYFYVAGQITDDHLLGVDRSLGNQGPPGWCCDSLMVAIASFSQPMKSNSPYSSTPFLALRYAPPSPGARGGVADAKWNRTDLYWALPGASRSAVLETPHGYNVEAAIPWKELQYVPQAGQRLFVALLAADVDPGQSLKQVGWGFSGNAKDHPLFRLADRPDVLGTVTVSADEVPQGKPWGVRVEMDARKGPAAIRGVRLVDAQHKTVWQRPASLEVPEGMTGRVVEDVPAEALPAVGSYTVEALAATGSGPSMVLAASGVRAVEPRPAPPIIKNRPGEIQHMAPDRVEHNAFAEHTAGTLRHGFVRGKDDYVPYLQTHVQPTLKQRAEGSLKSKSRWAHSDALRAVAVHRITGEEAYVGLARALMDLTLDQLNEQMDIAQFSAATRYRYLTWKADPASPFAPRDAEKRYRQALHKAAATPEAYLFNESGTHNRIWHRYVIQKVARTVAQEDGKPVDPRVIEYTDYHDQLLGVHGDTDDASAGYHWVFFNHAIDLYFFSGDWDAFRATPGFRRALARYAECVSPSGACAPYGDCSGWPEVGQSMWAYEWMSHLTGDGRFRWTAHRIAEYYYNHLDHRASQYHMPYDTARDNFTMAYLLADDAVAPKEPPAVSRVTWRHPMRQVSLERMKARPGTWIKEMDPDRWIPDKLVLSSGKDPQGLWGLVELLPEGGHAGELPGNILALMVHDSALYGGQGYYEHTPNYQNLVWIEDLEGLATDPRPLSVDVPVLVDDPAFTFARITTTAYQHLPVTYTRDVLFVKNGFLLLKDRIRFDTTMKVRLGPCFQTRCLGPQCGEHWFNAYYDQLYYTGLGLGRGVQAIPNPPWDLLVCFSPRADRIHTVQDHYQENPYRNSPVAMRQAWSGMARAGQELSFTTVLLPHAPTFTPKDLVDPAAAGKTPARIEIAQDDDQLTVVRAIAEMDPVHKFRSEYWVMLNDTGKTAKAGPLESDGRVALVGHSPDGRIRNRAIVAGTSLRYRDADQSAEARKHDAAPPVMPKELRATGK